MDVDDAPGPSTPPKDNFVYIPEPTLPTSPQPVFPYHTLDTASDPSICIDNGSHSWRAGYSNMAEPWIDRANMVARYRDKKYGRQVLLFGKDVETDSGAKGNIRQMFDGDLLVQQDILENALDFTFLNLGIDSAVEQPIVMTERLANPLFSRAITSELLFELYNAPAVSYGVDSLFAFSRQKHQDGLAINLGHNATTIIPVLNGKGVLSRSKRIPWGGAQASELMLKMAQLKYPSFPTKVTLPQATFMLHETCYFSSDYESELKSLEDPVNMVKQTKVVQFPYTVAETVEKTEEELAAALERRRENGKRLQEMQARQRAEKVSACLLAGRDHELTMRLAAKIAELDEYKLLVADRINMKRADFLRRISEETPFETEAELESWIKKTEADVKRKQRKEQGLEEPVEEEPSFPLVDRPDEELDEEEIKEKRRQRLMKAGWEARVKLREEKRREKERLEEEVRLEEQEKATDPVGWARRMKEEQEAVITRIEERKKKRTQLGDRKSAHSQARMKSIANLAAEDNKSKKRKKGEDDDGFGADDSDWAVYREIGGDDDSDAEEEDQNQLQAIETKLLEFDPDFTEEHTKEGREYAKHKLVNAFVRGGVEGRYDPEDLAQSHQLHLNVERIRVPETWFQPGMFGIDSAGVGEIAGWVLNGFEEEERRRMMQCIYVTGGCSSTPGLIPKLRNVLTPLLPYRTPLKVVASWDGTDPRLEAWKGMAAWAGTEAAKQARITRQEYDEHGAEWLKEHAWGNPPP